MRKWWIILVVVLAVAVAVDNAMWESEYHPIPVIGKTADGKYNVYQLEGNLDDVNYFSGNIVYSPDNLVKYMPFISLTDLYSRKYSCGFICKNKAGQVVGLNPEWADLYGKVPPK